MGNSSLHDRICRVGPATAGPEAARPQVPVSASVPCRAGGGLWCCLARSHLRGREPLPPRFSCPVEGVASRRKVRPVLPGRRGRGWGEMTRSGDLLGACTPKGTATYPANNAWTAAYPANHAGLALSLPGSSLPGRQPQRPSPTADLPGKSRRVCGVCAGLGAPGGPTRQITTRAHPVDLPGKSPGLPGKCALARGCWDRHARPV